MDYIRARVTSGPVTPMSLFFGLIGLLIITHFIIDGFSAASKWMNPPAISRCIETEIASPDVAETMSSSDWASDSDRVEHGRTITARTAAEDVASNCPADTCEDAELADYKAKVEDYFGLRPKRIENLSSFYGQPGIDSAVTLHDTFADKRIENSMLQMAAAGKLGIGTNGSAAGNREAQAFATFIKFGPDALVPCGSVQDLARPAPSQP
jgi:hypothetical protein